MAMAVSAMVHTSPAQKREEAAGSIINPTAINVPNAWKLETRFNTTRIRKAT
jgi:hypothetical protein